MKKVSGEEFIYDRATKQSEWAIFIRPKKHGFAWSEAPGTVNLRFFRAQGFRFEIPPTGSSFVYWELSSLVTLVHPENKRRDANRKTL